MVAIRGAERATDWAGHADAGPSPSGPGAPAGPAPEIVDRAPVLARDVTARDVDVLRTRLELLHDMADGDRKAREAQRISLRADLADAEQRVIDVQRDHRGIRQTLGDLATIVNRQMADGSATQALVNDLRTTVHEIRNEGREAIERAQRDARRSVEQLEAQARVDRDWIGATQALVERLADDLARQGGDVAALRDDIRRAADDELRHRAAELEQLGQLRDQLTAATAAISALREVTKRQAAQLTRLRADLKKGTAPPAPKAATKKQPAKATTAKKTPAKKTPAKRAAPPPAR